MDKSTRCPNYRRSLNEKCRYLTAYWASCNKSIVIASKKIVSEETPEILDQLERFLDAACRCDT